MRRVKCKRTDTCHMCSEESRDVRFLTARKHWILTKPNLTKPYITYPSVTKPNQTQPRSSLFIWHHTLRLQLSTLIKHSILICASGWHSIILPSWADPQLTKYTADIHTFRYTCRKSLLESSYFRVKFCNLSLTHCRRSGWVQTLHHTWLFPMTMHYKWVTVAGLLLWLSHLEKY